MPLFGKRRKRGGTLSRELAHGLLEDAMARAEAEQSGYRHVRTALHAVDEPDPDKTQRLGPLQPPGEAIE